MLISLRFIDDMLNSWCFGVGMLILWWFSIVYISSAVRARKLQYLDSLAFVLFCEFL
jgi:hypothetical protein